MVVVQDHKVAFRRFVVFDVGSCCVYESFRGNECDILVVVFSLISVGWSGQGIGWNVCVSGNIFDLVIVFLEVSVPSCCPSVEVLGGFPVLEVGVVGDNYEWFFCPSEVWPPVSERFHHG
jgi:hypothetical protein